MNSKDLNFLKSSLTLIEENAKQATPGPWYMNHGNVVAGDLEWDDEKKQTRDRRFDVAVSPFRKDQTVFNINPYATRNRDMRYVATVEPKRMLRLVQVVRELLPDERLISALSWVVLEAADLSEARRPDLSDQDAKQELDDIVTIIRFLERLGVDVSKHVERFPKENHP